MKILNSHLFIKKRIWFGTCVNCDSECVANKEELLDNNHGKCPICDNYIHFKSINPDDIEKPSTKSWLTQQFCKHKYNTRNFCEKCGHEYNYYGQFPSV